MDLIENKQYSFKSILNSILILIFFSINLQSQEKNIEIKSAGSFDRNESLFPDGNILGESQTKKVHLRHDEMDIFSKKSIFFQKRNSFIATGKVHVKQGDSINLFCDSLNYDGISRKFSSYGSVRFINDEMELNSSVLFFDRNINEIFFNEKGRIIDSLSTIESKKGKYLIDQKKYEFEDNVVINNPNYKIRSDMMDYYLDTELAYFFKQSTIKTENYNIFCNKGFYDTKNKIGIFKNEAKITSEERIIYGDSIYFDDNLEYASASKNIRIIDISADFRITNAEVWEEWYGQKHLSPSLLSESIYGLPEIPGQRQKIREALIVANPGCYPTSALLALLPIHSTLDKQQIIVNSTSGISGAGRNLDSRKLFAEGHDNFQAYAVGSHRHYPEMLQTLNKANATLANFFVPHLSSIVRGIYSTINLRYEFEEIDEVIQDYKAFYDDSPFVQIITDQTFPKISETTGTNMCKISIHKVQPGDEGVNIVILSALDNLIKGASGQAVQNMNIMFDLDEKLSLV